MGRVPDDYLKPWLAKSHRKLIEEHGCSGRVSTYARTTKHCGESFCDEYIKVMDIFCNHCGTFLFTTGKKDRTFMHKVVETGHG
jgi:hypothetical protein